MLQYAQDALETEHPELRWERRRPGEEWHPFDKDHPPSWDVELEYRHKPRTMTYTVTMPAPMLEAPEVCETYYIADPKARDFYDWQYWRNDEIDMRFLTRGLCFATKEDAIAAAKAMVPVEGEQA